MHEVPLRPDPSQIQCTAISIRIHTAMINHTYIYMHMYCCHDASWMLMMEGNAKI